MSQQRSGTRLRSWTGSPNRGRRGANIEAVTARDETDAYHAMKQIKRRAARDRQELRERDRPKITLPTFKLADQDDER